MLGRMGDKQDKPTLKISIEENLRKVYQDLLAEDVPDRFRQLLAELQNTHGAKAGPDGEGGK